MRQDRQHRGELFDEVAAGIAEEGFGAGKSKGQKSDERAAREKGDERHEILRDGGGGGGEAEIKCANGPEAAAQAIHVIHEVEGVDDGEDPENGYGKTECEVGNEKGDACAGSGD